MKLLPQGAGERYKAKKGWMTGLDDLATKKMKSPQIESWSFCQPGAAIERYQPKTGHRILLNVASTETHLGIRERDPLYQVYLSQVGLEQLFSDRLAEDTSPESTRAVIEARNPLGNESSHKRELVQTRTAKTTRRKSRTYPVTPIRRAVAVRL